MIPELMFVCICIIITFFFLRKRRKEHDPFANIQLKQKATFNNIPLIFEKYKNILKNGLPVNVVIINCFPDNYYFNPPKEMKTKNLTIINNSNIRINWNKFTNLESLFILANDFNIEDLAICTKLTNVKIKLQKDKEIPLFFYSLPNLKVTTTMCHSKLISKKFVQNKNIKIINNYEFL